MTVKPTFSILQFFLIFIILSMVPTLFFISEWQRIEQRSLSLVEQETRAQLEFSQRSLQSTIIDIEATIELLSSNSLLYSAVLENNESNYDAVEDLWILIARSKGYFSKLRFLSNTGQEQIRVNSVANYVEVVSDEFLQNKAHRDYFKYATTLKTNQSGRFGIDVEYDNHKIVTPITPALRIIIPVDINFKRYGYFIANLDFNAIYDSLNYGSGIQAKPDLINSNGFYLQSQTFSQILGDVIADHKGYNLNQLLPKVWESAQSGEEGNVFDAGSWWSYAKVNVSKDVLGEDLYLVLNVPDQKINQQIESEYKQISFLAIAVYIITLLLSFVFCAWNVRHKKHSIESQIARVAMNGMSAVLISDKNNRILSVNKEFTRLSGYTLEEVKGKSPSIFTSGKHQQEFYMQMWKQLLADGMWEGEVTNRRKDGSLITEILRIQTVTDNEGKVIFYVGSFVDITQRKILENRLRDLSEKDALSGLWNRRKFDKQIRREARRSRRYPDKYQSCIAIIDIDNFKRINDELGHSEGDKVIKSVSSIILDQIRETDFLARIGGEEFGLIMPHTPLAEAEIVLNRLRTAIYLHHEHSVSVSGGVSNVDSSIENSYQRADIALYEAKSSGKNCISMMTSQEAHEIA
ncbi:sensor domain-containing diguanylate cyclase [Vibrio sp. YMD68]|uniref:sensor domain-containing diguanylate cyclase n=1 Tax=Vibrio sp. YMD68 TaxID=3042300 RepID=UPI00249A4C9D|nr:sensor domain-containing diguanylate cyclase [Vibrio sp. YMD68]WGV98141.1 sensor domain-containing diguanylate cyclase [Vibrio sp. YMD68]